MYYLAHDFEEPDHLGKPSHHVIHCLQYLRQIFLCNADMTLEKGDFLKRNYTVDRVSETRKCRDWKTVGEKVDLNTKEWFEYNGLPIDI